MQRFFNNDKEVKQISNKYLSVFNHTHLLGVQDFFSDEPFFYTVTPCFDSSLRENLKHLTPEIQNSWLIQLATAIDTLHSNKILHKYIHPG